MFECISTIEEHKDDEELEEDVVIVLLPDWYIYEKDRFLSQVYTGITRPKSLLKVIIGKSNLELLNKTSSLSI